MKLRTFNVENNQITNSKCEKLLGIKIDEICKKAGQKMNALSRVIPNMNITKRFTLLNAFFMSQCNYYHLTWMCHSHAKNKINRLHGRCLRIIYKDKVYTFEQLLEKDSSVLIHIKNLRFLVVEMFKGYLCYKAITSQNVPSKAQIK